MLRREIGASKQKQLMGSQCGDEGGIQSSEALGIGEREREGEEKGDLGSQGKSLEWQQLKKINEMCQNKRECIRKSQIDEKVG